MAISFFYLAIPVGSALGYIAGSVIAAHHGWRAAFVWAGYPGLAIALGLFFFREPPRGAAETTKTQLQPAGVRAFVELLQRPNYLLVVAGYAAQTFALGGFALWAPTFLQRVHHMGLAEAGQFFGGSLVIMGLLATLIGGMAATAWQRRSPAGYAWVLALSAALAVPAGFAAFLSADLTSARVALVVAMFLLFLPTGPVNTLILETVPVAMRATAMAASIFAIHALGDLWSPAIVGRLSDSFGSLRTGVLLLPVALIFSAMFWLALATRMRRSPGEVL